jgi:hypothetical protein
LNTTNKTNEKHKKKQNALKIKQKKQTKNQKRLNTTKNKSITQNPGHILKGVGEKGMIFTLDAGIAFTIMLIGMLVFATTLANTAEKAGQNITNFELEEKALMIADTFVKNYDENNTLRGACIYDKDKKRILTNELSSKNIQTAKQAELERFFVKSITYKTKTKEKTIQFTQKENGETEMLENSIKECLTVKRFVLIDGEKGETFIQTCEAG